MRYEFNDGGKKAEGLGTARSADCCIRSVAIATGDSYKGTKKAMNRLLFEMTGSCLLLIQYFLVHARQVRQNVVMQALRTLKYV